MEGTDGNSFCLLGPGALAKRGRSDDESMANLLEVAVLLDCTDLVLLLLFGSEFMD